MIEPLSESVQRGIVLLDRKQPDWFTRIDTQRLDINECYDCILGQLFGSYTEGRKQLDLLDRYDASTGFIGDNESYGVILTEYWRAAIRERMRD